jgi:hypothetical protein
MKTRLLAASFILAVCAAGQATPRVQRVTMIPVEKSLDNRIVRFSAEDPMYVLGGAHGVYLDGFGFVVSTEVDLIPAANITPFNTTFTKEQKDRFRIKKLDRIEKLKALMFEVLVDAAAMLDTVPANEQIAVAVTIFNKPWEVSSGMPGQIVMQTTKKALVQYKTSAAKTKLETLNAVLKVQEY